MSFKFVLKNKASSIPKTSGVYVFSASTKKKSKLRRIRRISPSASVGRKKGGEFLYIGKALNLRERIKNHFQQPNFKDNIFLNLVSKIGFIKTDSEIEALILEAHLIKKYQPKYNVVWRDDKNFSYVAIGGFGLPRVLITRQPKRTVSRISYIVSGKLKKSQNTKYQIQDTKYVGPFVDGKALKQTLRFLRKIFPYYTTKKHTKKQCWYCNLSLCPGSNPNLKEYRENIRNLISVLKGKKKSVLKNLKKEMKLASSMQEFEKAAKIRDQIIALEKILVHTKIFGKRDSSNELSGPWKNHYVANEWGKTKNELKRILKTKKRVSRIEAYDISNIQGKEATGSMVTFINGKADKNFYRKFKIRITHRPNDIAMIKEVLSRRFGHPEWPFPDVILIDGGKAQLNAVKSIIDNKQLTIPVVSLAKRNNELFLENHKLPILLKTLPRAIFNLILQLRDESHRFALAYHKKLRKKALLGESKTAGMGRSGRESYPRSGNSRPGNWVFPGS